MDSQGQLEIENSEKSNMSACFLLCIVKCWRIKRSIDSLRVSIDSLSLFPKCTMGKFVGCLEAVELDHSLILALLSPQCGQAAFSLYKRKTHPTFRSEQLMLPQLSKQCMFVAILRMFAAVKVGVKLFMMSAGFVAMQVSLDLGSRV